MKNKNLIIAINLGDSGSTGNIMLNSLEYAHKHSCFDVFAIIPYESHIINKVRTISFATEISPLKRKFYGILRKLKFPIINDGNYYKENSKNLIKLIKRESIKYKTTIIHMHNMHHAKLDVNYFYKFLMKHNYPTIYTLHDCWTFTGGCYYYDYINCANWQTKCKNCPQKIKYSSKQLNKRTKLLNKIPNLLMVPVSNWANEELKQSRLKNIPSIVNRGETSLKPLTIDRETAKKELGLNNKKVLLFVCAYWDEWKGGNYIYQLADIIPDNYILIVVGSFDKKDYQNIEQINNMKHDLLAKYYTAADVYVSVTQSEQLGLTTCEAQMCGTPVVGFGRGGSKETFIDGKTGILVENGNILKMHDAIIYVVDNNPFNKKEIIDYGNNFMKYEHAKRQLIIYNELVKNFKS